MTTHLPTASVCAPLVAERLLGLADDELVMGHRHSEWLGLSPFLEEDLTMASIAQDELGHARALYAIVWPDLPDRDALVMQRGPDAYRSCDLVELGGLAWEVALVRHWLYDVAEHYRWAALADLDVVGLRDLVATVREEERFHRRHAEDLVSRLCTGSTDARNRIQQGLDLLWPYVVAMLADDPDVIGQFDAALRLTTEVVGLRVSTAEVRRSDRHVRHADFAEVHRAFTDVFAIDPEASW